ncbi:MAG: sugar ABC transporter ATP-binding protein [Anaerolineae bacterium]|nr:sugar ABC transporter ATP-binding protein [Anaerolineae bacterium]
MSTVLETQGLCKSFFGIAAVQDVSIRVDEGQILGLIGQNGAGKSTLMNLIGGVVQPDSGQMIYQGKPYSPRGPADATAARIAFIHQELNLFTNLSIAENVFIEAFPTIGRGPFRVIDRAAVRRKTKEVLEAVGLDLSPDMQVDRMSPGERQLAEIAKALYLDASLLILDEPTTSLTSRETEKLFEIMRRLRERGKALIYISHILPDVLSLSDSIAIMRDGRLVTQESSDKFTVDRMIALMVGRSIEQLYPPRTAAPSHETLLELKGVSARGIVENVNFTVKRGEVVGLFGLMGSGRTELARMVFGLDSFEKGEIVVNDRKLEGTSARRSIRNNVAFVTENRREEGLLMNINIADNIALVSLPSFARTPVQVISQPELVSSVERVADALQLKSGNIVTQPAKALSGGNQQKVVVAKWLLSSPTVFIMDEPTRGIDVGAKYEIYNIIDQLAANGSGVLFISSELEELMGMCDRILVMSRGEIFGEFTRVQFDQEVILRAAFRETANGKNGNGSHLS